MVRTAHAGSYSTNNKQSLKQEIFLRVDNLIAMADILIVLSQRMQRTRRRYGETTTHPQLVQRAQNIRQLEIEAEQIRSLFAEFVKDSNAISEHVNIMHENFHALVEIFLGAREIANKKASKNKRLRRFVWTLKFVNAGIGAGAAFSRISPMPAGLVASVALSAAAVVIAAVTEAIDKFREGKRRNAITAPTI